MGLAVWGWGPALGPGPQVPGPRCVWAALPWRGHPRPFGLRPPLPPSPLAVPPPSPPGVSLRVTRPIIRPRRSPWGHRWEGWPNPPAELALDAAEPSRLQLPEVSRLQLAGLAWTLVSDTLAGQCLQKWHPFSQSETNQGLVGGTFPILRHPLRKKNGIERKNVSAPLSV